MLKNCGLKHKNKELVLTLVNHVLKIFLEWHIFESKVGFVPILKPVVEQLFSKMTKEQIIEMAANTGKEEVQNAIIL
jgi:hypothetical protein